MRENFGMPTDFWTEMSKHLLVASLDVRKRLTSNSLPLYKQVIFNPPATIVYWVDATKTVVKCQDGDEFSEENGFMRAVLKKMCENTGKYNDYLKNALEMGQRIDKKEKKNESTDSVLVAPNSMDSVTIIRRGKKITFKVGDKVRIRQWDDMVDEFGLTSIGSVNVSCGFTKRMRPLCGKIGTIEALLKDCGMILKSKDLLGYAISAGMIEPLT